MLNEKLKPVYSISLLLLIAAVCVCAGVIAPGDPTRMDFDALNMPPNAEHIFGTDQLGRDMFKMILHGGRVSLFVGVFASAISALIAMVYGAAAGLAARPLDNFLMRFSELLLSIPSILYVVSIQAILGKPTVVSISVVIGITSWANIAKIVRAEVRQIGKSEYISASRLMGARFAYILRRHLLPNFIPSIMFMLIYNVSQAIAAEATLSFLGLGLPPSAVSWGTLMSLSQDALLTNSYWIICIPTLFLVVTLVCIVNIGEYLRKGY
ncbi:MAG: ABC transporter permease [Clostridiales Family XIII bacterium]|nr:ABC transporter permease [Clostridiales Family XIII bacterium]